MTRPIDAADALRRAVERQRVPREAIREEAERIAREREEETSRTTESESPR